MHNFPFPTMGSPFFLPGRTPIYPSNYWLPPMQSLSKFPENYSLSSQWDSDTISFTILLLVSLGLVVVAYSLSSVRLLQSHGLQVLQAPLSMNFPGKNTGMGCHFLLQGIFPTQRSNPHLQHCRQSPKLQACSLLLNHQGTPG